MDKKDFGEWLKAKRKAQKLTQRELAEKCGICRECICWWENGKNSPTLENADKLVKALGTSLTIGESKGSRIYKKRYRNLE